MSQHARNTSAALALFDSLPAVDVAQLQGFWQGEGFHTGHPLDGLLEVAGWLGKHFGGPEDVQPLVVRSVAGPVSLRGGAARLAIAWVLRFPSWKTPLLAPVLRVVLPLLATRRSQARLRRIEHRGVVTATIVYDSVPIQDALRQLDAGTLLGLMDLKGMEQPLFFQLRR